MSKQEAIKLACFEYDYKFPKNLHSGIMFYCGYKITIDEFNQWARKFK
jgi:hypothetical protein